jgi:hypothetical protein
MDNQGSTGTVVVNTHDNKNVESVLAQLRAYFPNASWLNTGNALAPSQQEYQGSNGELHYNFLKATVNASGHVKIALINTQTQQVVGAAGDPRRPCETQWHLVLANASSQLKSQTQLYQNEIEAGLKLVLNQV